MVASRRPNESERSTSTGFERGQPDHRTSNPAPVAGPPDLLYYSIDSVGIIQYDSLTETRARAAGSATRSQ